MFLLSYMYKVAKCVQLLLLDNSILVIMISEATKEYLINKLLMNLL